MRGAKVWFAAASLVLLPVSAAAQDKPFGAPDVGYISNGLLDAAPPPPLTPEQQARLPLATALAEKVIPPGSMNDMLSGMFGGTLAPLAADAEPDPYSALSRRGIFMGREQLDESRARRMAAMLDPAWDERERRERALTAQAIGGIMETMEPLLRQAMAEMYAIHFSAAELADIDAFFATPSGAAYARQSYRMSSDPRMTGAMMGIIPQALGQVAALEGEAAGAMAGLPPQRHLADLSSNEKKLLAQWLGIGVEDLEFTLIDAPAAP
jgi:Uncharacterized protein conserved in bacteria (DUF2059)